MHVTSPPAVSAGSTQSLFKCCSFSYPLAPAPSCCQARSNLSNKHCWWAVWSVSGAKAP